MFAYLPRPQLRDLVVMAAMFGAALLVGVA